MQRNKVFSALFSIALAFCLWLYVITVDSPDYRDTIYDIPLTLVGETALQNRNLVLTDISSETVDITFSGNRSDLPHRDRSNSCLPEPQPASLLHPEPCVRSKACGVLILAAYPWLTAPVRILLPCFPFHPPESLLEWFSGYFH